MNWSYPESSGRGYAVCCIVVLTGGCRWGGLSARALSGEFGSGWLMEGMSGM